MSRSVAAPMVSIVVPTYRRQDDLRRLVESITQSRYPRESIEIIVVDNANDPELAATVRGLHPNMQVLVSPTNLYSNGARRLGSAAATGDYIFLLDDDNMVEPDCIARLVQAMQENPTFGAVGPIMLDGDSNTIWSAGAHISGMGLPRYIFGGQAFEPAELPKFIYSVDYFPNACMVRRSVLQQVPLDDSAFPHNWAETDFCLRIIAAGYDVVCVTAAIDRHFIGYKGTLTRIGIDKTYDQAKSRILFRRRHMPTVIDWFRFWVVIFPVSSVVYLWRIVRTPQNKAKILAAYIRGTRDGLLQPLQRLP